MSMKLPAVFLLLIVSSALAQNSSNSELAGSELAGIWEGRRHYGPEVRGTLTVKHEGDVWRAEIAGYSVNARFKNNEIDFGLPGDRGQFSGKLDSKNGLVRGHWIQPPTVNNGSKYASPVTLRTASKGIWRGEVVPLTDEFTFYLVVTAGADGKVGAWIQNPDRNLGVFLNAERLERRGDTLMLIGHARGSSEQRTVAEGKFRAGDDRNHDLISLYFENRGGSFDFHRIDGDDGSGFYAKGKTPSKYRYSPPLREDDGWTTGTLGEVGLSEDLIGKFIESAIYPQTESVHDPIIHGVLIARHGKLVLEEYFHGFHRDKPHDTRSASKSLTATLVGAAIENGAHLSLSTPVYQAIYGDKLPADLDPRKKKMTVENLLTMSSGYYCDDADPKAPGNEDVMQEQSADPDWYHYTLNLPMALEPGERAIYCSVNPNLLGAVLTASTGKPLSELFDDLIAVPLQIKRYYLTLSPKGEPYMGGGIYWLPRDFMKLGQVMLNEGMWNQRRIVSREFAKQATSPLRPLGKFRYGYLWWNVEYPYKGKTIRAFFAGGNGGQVVMGIPDLDLVIAFYAGNYADRVAYKIQDEFVPKYILPAIKEGTEATGPVKR